MVVNINCKFCSPHNLCDHPSKRKTLGLFKPRCVLVYDRSTCEFQKIHPRPAPPAGMNKSLNK